MRLSDNELQRLEDFLGSDSCGEEAMFVDEVHGLLSAVVCSPDFVPPDEWLPLICDGEPEYGSLQQQADFVALLTRLHNEIVDCLNGGKDFLPLFVRRLTEEGESVLDAEGWCQGFIRGMSLRDEVWRDAVRGELGTLLYPILLIATDGREILENAVEPPFDIESYQELSDLIPDALAAVFAYWNYGERGGRELCPCGSGAGFAVCCGAERTLH